jgi:cytochrome c-type biogenesis protein
MIQGSLQRFGITTLSFLMIGLIAFSWLVFPYFMNGDQMLFETGEQVQNERYFKYSTLSRILTRFIPFPGGIEVKVLYASNDYFEYADRGSAVEVFRPDTHFVFFVNEDVHTGYLPQGLAGAVLEVDGHRFEAVSSEGPDLVEHHRTTIIRFSKYDENGKPIIGSDSKELRLTLTHPWDRYKVRDNKVVPINATYVWQLPLEIPDELKSRDTFTSAMVLSLSAGLLASVLTPCLIQLVLIFFATLGGLSASEVSMSHKATPEARRRILWAAISFVTAYVGLFIASGALIGYAGKEAQLFFANYTRPVGIGAGIIVILFGIWIGIQSRTPLVCSIPGADFVQKIRGKGTLATVMISIAFSLGCMSCFGGAIIGTLFIYVGALGSASAGAAVMGLFAVGVAIPFLLAAAFFSKMRPMFDFVARHYRAVGAASTIIIISFGLLLVTDNFHTVSDLIYPYLGLG